DSPKKHGASSRSPGRATLSPMSVGLHPGCLGCEFLGPAEPLLGLDISHAQANGAAFDCGDMSALSLHGLAGGKYGRDRAISGSVISNFRLRPQACLTRPRPTPFTSRCGRGTARSSSVRPIALPKCRCQSAPVATRGHAA